MTDDRIVLIELLEKSGDAVFLCEMLSFVAARLMALEIDGLCGTGPSECSPERVNHRNGYRERCWETRAGTLDLQIPKLRKGSYFPAFLEARKTAEKALVAVVQEAYVQGVSTRCGRAGQGHGHERHLQEPGVQAVCRDRRAGHDFPERPIEGRWPYLWLDATYVKVRCAGRIVSAAVIVAVGANTEGHREVLRLAVGPSEAERFWTDFLRSLAHRGLRGVKLVISDAHQGLKAAVAKVLGATWQHCRVHFMRNALAHARKGQREMVAAAIRTAFVQKDADTATRQWRQIADSLRPRSEMLAKLMDDTEPDVLAFMTFPSEHWTNVFGIFPNPA